MISITTYMKALREAHAAIFGGLAPGVRLSCEEGSSTKWELCLIKNYGSGGLKYEGDSLDECLETALDDLELKVNERLKSFNELSRRFDDIQNGRGNLVLPYGRRVDIGVEVPKREESEEKES